MRKINEYFCHRGEDWEMYLLKNFKKKLQILESFLNMKLYMSRMTEKENTMPTQLITFMVTNLIEMK